jgi:alkanesulfonate monooxygenase SsuD/methylene tetrahydromethanopterin reductase-like flavin-dependent oxidoreductase (luciferase family)
MSLLAYLAARTERIRLGTAVVVLPWHNPILVAEQAATLDLLSNGRLDFGVGKGYRAYEFSGFCIPQAEATERFDEAMEVNRKAWSSPGASPIGKRWRFENVSSASDQQPHPPFWLGAGSVRSIRRAAPGLQPAARPDSTHRSDHRPPRSSPGMRAGRPAWIRCGRRDPQAADRAQ